MHWLILSAVVFFLLAERLVVRVGQKVPVCQDKPEHSPTSFAAVAPANLETAAIQALAEWLLYLGARQLQHRLHLRSYLPQIDLQEISKTV